MAEKLIGLAQLDDRKRQRRKVPGQKSSHSDVNPSKLNPLRSPGRKRKGPDMDGSQKCTVVDCNKSVT